MSYIQPAYYVIRSTQHAELKNYFKSYSLAEGAVYGLKLDAFRFATELQAKVQANRDLFRSPLGYKIECITP